MTTPRFSRPLIVLMAMSLSVSGCSSFSSKGTSSGASDINDALAEENFDFDGDVVDPELASEELGAMDGDEISLDDVEQQASNAGGDDELSLDDTEGFDDFSDQEPMAEVAGSSLQGEPEFGDEEPIDDLLDMEGEDPNPALAGEPELEPESALADEVEAVESPVVSTVEAASETDVTDLRYVASQDGGTVVIETSTPATYRTREVPSQNQVVIEIANARLPEHLKRPYVTKDFKQSIVSINAYQDKGSTTARVVVQFAGPTTANVTQTGRSLTVAAAGGGFDIASRGSQDFADSAGLPDSGVEAAVLRGQGSDISDPRILPTSSLDLKDTDEIRFYGKPISIEVYDTPIRDVISLIAEQSGANLIVSDDVNGQLSLKLRQIPWDQALLLVMKSKNLGYVRQGSVLRIAPILTLQKESEDALRVVEAQKASEPLKVKVIPVSYANVTNLQTQVTAFLSKRGKAVADVRTSSLLVTDLPENLERISNLVTSLDTPPLQVLIEGKVVEARETFRRDFGINWGASGQQIELGGNLNISPSLSVSPIPTGAPSIGDVGVRLGTLDILGDLDASLALFESEDLVKVVSSPRIVAMNNIAASIVQSMNIPIQTQTIGTGTTSTGIDYKPIELKLEVTPQVTSGGDVIMQLNIRREFAANRQAGQEPDINSREAKTTVMVRNGQTAVVGGVYQSDASDTEQGVPYLRNIPILGWLFKYKGKTAEKNELLVFLTPRILNAEKSLPKEGTL